MARTGQTDPRAQGSDDPAGMVPVGWPSGGHAISKGDKQRSNKEAKKPKKVVPKPSAVPQAVAERNQLNIARKKVK